MACGHEAFPVRPPEAWSSGGEEHERGEVPEAKVSGANIRDGEDYLGEKSTARHRGNLAVPLDRPDLQFTVGRLMSAITKPQRKHLAMMKHCLRYMVGRRCCTWKFDYQEVARRAGDPD